MASEIKPGDRVLVELDVLGVFAEDTPVHDPYYAGVYIKAGCLKLGYAGEPGDDWIHAPAESVVHVATVPSVTPGLLAAAQAVNAAAEQWTEGQLSEFQWVPIDRFLLESLRSASELAAATAGPVALTDDEKRQASQRAITIAFRGYGSDKTASDWFNEFVDAFLSDLGDIGYAIVRRPS